MFLGQKEPNLSPLSPLCKKSGDSGKPLFMRCPQCPHCPHCKCRHLKRKSKKINRHIPLKVNRAGRAGAVLVPVATVRLDGHDLDQPTATILTSALTILRP